MILAKATYIWYVDGLVLMHWSYCSLALSYRFALVVSTVLADGFPPFGAKISANILITKFALYVKFSIWYNFDCAELPPNL